MMILNKLPCSGPSCFRRCRWTIATLFYFGTVVMLLAISRSTTAAAPVSATIRTAETRASASASSGTSREGGDKEGSRKLQQRTTAAENDLFEMAPTSTSSSSSSSSSSSAPPSRMDVIAILPDRSTAYANGIHNGLLQSSYKLNISLSILDFGNYNPELSHQVLQNSIDTPTALQPRMYIVWPIDVPSKRLIQTLHQTHGHAISILQINQIPSVDTEWEWDHLLGYAGQSDEVRATNAGDMMAQALQERNLSQSSAAVVVALGYPITYGGFHVAAAAFRQALSIEPGIQSVEILPLEWGSQNAYDQMVLILDALIEQGVPLHGVYAMDDDILLGAYQAIVDRRNHRLKKKKSNTEEEEEDDPLLQLDWLDEITLVGTGCNGARSLLEDGSQYGTTVQSPYLEALLAMDMVHQFLSTGFLPPNETIRFTPSPIVTGATMNSLLIPFMNDVYVGDELCTWNLHHTPSEGLLDPTLPQDICDWTNCLFVPDALLYAGYTMVGLNYALAVLCASVVVLFRKKRIMTLAQPPFLLLVIFGACIDTTSILFMGQDNRDTNMTQAEMDASCFAWPWLLTMGQMLTTATLVAKIYRVKVVTNGGGGGGSTGSHGSRNQNNKNKGFRRVKVSARDVSYFIVGGLLLDLIILMVWHQTDPFVWQIQVVQTDPRGHILLARRGCASDGEYYWLYPAAIVLLNFALLIYANVLAYQTRLYHRISDSHMVAISLFNSIQLLLVATLMLSLSGDNVSITYLVRSSYAFLTNFGVLCLVVVPKVYQCLLGKEEQTHTIISGLTPPCGTTSLNHHPVNPHVILLPNESTSGGYCGGPSLQSPESANCNTGNGVSPYSLSTSVVSLDSVSFQHLESSSVPFDVNDNISSQNCSTNDLVGIMEEDTEDRVAVPSLADSTTIQDDDDDDCNAGTKSAIGHEVQDTADTIHILN